MKSTWTRLTPGERDLIAMQIDQHQSDSKLTKVLNQLEVCYHQCGNFTTALVRFPDGSLRVGTAKRNSEEDVPRAHYATGLSLIRALAKHGPVVPKHKDTTTPKLRANKTKVKNHLGDYKGSAIVHTGERKECGVCGTSKQCGSTSPLGKQCTRDHLHALDYTDHKAYGGDPKALETWPVVKEKPRVVERCRYCLHVKAVHEFTETGGGQSHGCKVMDCFCANFKPQEVKLSTQNDTPHKRLQ